MHPNRRNFGAFVLTLAAAVAACALGSGCSQSAPDAGRTIAVSGQELRQQEKTEIARIQNDSRLPPQARAAALRQRELMKKAMMQSSHPAGSP